MLVAPHLHCKHIYYSYVLNKQTWPPKPALQAMDHWPSPSKSRFSGTALLLWYGILIQNTRDISSFSSPDSRCCWQWMGRSLQCTQCSSYSVYVLSHRIWLVPGRRASSTFLPAWRMVRNEAAEQNRSHLTAMWQNPLLSLNSRNLHEEQVHTPTSL